MGPRQRDLWTSYAAQVIIGWHPKDYPEISGDFAVNAREQQEISPLDHSTTDEDASWVEQMVRRYLPCPPNDIQRARTQILKFCAEHVDQYPYDLVIMAEKTMKENNVVGSDRIAIVVCEEMLKIHDTIMNARAHSQDDIRRRRLSLRFVLLRLCKESDTFPTSLFVPGVALPSDEVPIFGGPSSDIYRCTTPSGLYVALKVFRVFDLERRHTEFSKALMAQAVILHRLEHDNILRFMGLYKQQRKRMELTYIVSPWMEHGDIAHYMRRTEHNKIPRIRWISEVASGLRYLHDECVVHGNLNEGNILVDDNMRVRIADFGLSNLPELTTQTSATEYTTIWWSAPELLEEGAIPTYTSDVWAFGCVCLFIWTGERPYNNCKSLPGITRQLLDPRRNPENPDHPMDTFYANKPKERSRGTMLREHVALPCWSRRPDDRPTMKDVEVSLQQNMKRFDT